MRFLAVACLTFACALLALSAIPWGAQTDPGWQLVWNDEFDGPADARPDPKKWSFDTGASGWGNAEQQRYTASARNAFLDGKGHLVIQVNRNGAGKHYTSARIKTQDHYTFTYGKIEARIQVPFAPGLWPAFWMLGSNVAEVGWPTCGEIDILENFGPANRDAAINRGAVHGPGFGQIGIAASYALAGSRFADDFHVFSAEWSPGSVKLAADRNVYSTVTAAQVSSVGGRWVFDGNPMFLILNVAVGSRATPAPVGIPDVTTRFPQRMLVDWVRVYQLVADPARPEASRLSSRRPREDTAQGSPLRNRPDPG